MKKKLMAAGAAFLFSLILLVPLAKSPSYVQAAQACPICTKTMDTIYIENLYSPDAEIHYDAYWYCYNCNVRDDYPYCTWDSHNLYQAGVSMQTCTEDGWYKAGCLTCGASQIHITGYAAGHSWTEWYEENPATCFGEGFYSRYCTECYVDDYYYTPKTSHEGGQWHLEYCASAYGPGKKVQNCKYCGIELAVEWVDHEYNAWTVAAAPTCTAPGKEVTTCRWCSESASRLTPALGHVPSGWIPAYFPADGENGYTYRVCNRCGVTCDFYSYPLELPDLNEIPQVLMPLAQALSPHDGLVLRNPLAQEEGAKDLEMTLFDPASGTICCQSVKEADDYRIDLYIEDSERHFTLLENLTSEGPVFQLKEQLDQYGEGAYSVVVWARKNGHRISAMVPASFVYMTQVPDIQDCQALYNYAFWTPGRHLPDEVVYQVDIHAGGKLVNTVRTREPWLDMEPYGSAPFTLKITASAPFFESSEEYTSEELQIQIPDYYRLDEEAVLYAQADTASEKKGTLSKGEVLRVWEKQGDLYRIDLKGDEYWARCSALSPTTSKAGKKVMIDLGDSKKPVVLYTSYDGTVGELVLTPEALAEHPGEKIIGFTRKYGSFLTDTIPAVDEDTTFYASWGEDPDLVKVILPLSEDEEEAVYLPEDTATYGLPLLLEEKGPFTVTFDPGMGACEYSKLTTKDPYKPEYYGTIHLHTIPLACSDEEGLVFAGWRCDSEEFIQANGTDRILSGQTVVILQDELFTAVYEPESVKE